MKQKKTVNIEKVQDFEEDKNTIRLVGTICEEPRVEYVEMGKKIYIVPVCIARFSGEKDIVRVEMEEDVLRGYTTGARVKINGYIKSFDKADSTGKTHLVITVVAKTCEQADETATDENSCMLAGHICSAPKNRLTPRGVEITDMLLACTSEVTRGQKANYIPLVTWFDIAKTLKDVCVGTGMVLQGRLQSREYAKRTEQGIEKRVAYEVSVNDATIFIM